MHNIRSSLDIIIFSMIGKNSDKIRELYFPFSYNLESFEKQLINGSIKYAGNEVINVLKDIKPYNGGNNLLYNIHRLNIIDKHRLLIISHRVAVLTDRQMSELIGIKIINGNFIFNGIGDELVRVSLNIQGNRKERRTVRSKGSFDVECEGDVKFYLGFAKGQPCAGQDVVETLAQFANLAEATVDRLTRAYLSPSNRFPT
ncbi:hypothetical protein [Ancylobacter pratisalsi]|uniref:Uncharacterized protein n=1 Tax=Ancylobacter pratisalsi TaxID=1745854 RepID=A0A6P1YNQ0_9HYPH|nr:hypothetical protein [Ancylobacter pratisalsi]QIB35087.1 hypothetical protein G3A50_16260 [Ancylobacter pratisalsi]